MRGTHGERLVEKKIVEEGEMERGDDRGLERVSINNKHTFTQRKYKREGES